jgi:DNA-binding NarL/FixJ family response regulator
LRDSESWICERSKKAGPERKSKVRVLLADDHEAILTRVRALLDRDFDVVAAVSNGRDAVMEVQRLDPDVLVIDIAMPVLDGLRAVSVLGSNRRAKVVFLTLHKDRAFAAAAFAAGASAYVVKSDIVADLVPAIRAAMDGHRYVSRSIQPIAEALLSNMKT